MASRLFKLGQVALVTGASSGIGSATARLLAKQGASVAVMGRNLDSLNNLASGIGENAAHVVTGDVRENGDIESAVSSVMERFGRLDMLVNCAGVLKGGATQDTSLEIWDTNFDTNTKGSYMCIKACIPHLAEQKGSIVNVSSVNGMQSFGGVMAYCASKAAVDQMTRCAAVDLATLGIRVNAVNPGVTRTELQKRGGLDEEAYAAFLERSTVTHPLGRIAEPEEVANLIAFLANNDLSGFITGAVIPIDGGRACLGVR